jgi:hypothetical protein
VERIKKKDMNARMGISIIMDRENMQKVELERACWMDERMDRVVKKDQAAMESGRKHFEERNRRAKSADPW